MGILALVGFSFFAACLAFVYVNSALTVYAILVLFFFILVFSLDSVIKKRSNTKIIAVLLSILSALIICTYKENAEIKNVQNLDGERANIAAVVKNIKENTGSVTVSAEIKEIELINSNKKIKSLKEGSVFSFTESKLAFLDEGDVLSGEFKLSKTEKRFDGKYADRIYITAQSTGNIKYIKPDKTDFLAKLRKTTKNYILRNLMKTEDGFTARLSYAMLTGDKESIPDNVRGEFYTAGVSHILVVSGMHLMLVAGFVTALFSSLGLSRRKTYLLSFIVVLVFLVLTGFRPSSTRAALMYAVLIFAKMFGFEYDSYSALGLSILIICLNNPFAVTDIGLLYSFFAVLGIEVFSAPLSSTLGKYNRKLFKHSAFSKITDYIKSAFAMCLAANVGLLPVTVLLEGSDIIISVISGTLIAPLSTLLMTVSSITGIVPACSFIVLLLSPLSLVSGIASRLMLFICEKTSGINSISPHFAAGIISFFIALIILVSFSVRRKPRALALLCCLIIIISAGLVEGKMLKDNTFLAVVTGSKAYSAVLVTNGEAEVFVADNSTYYDITSVLNKLRVKNVKSITLKKNTNEKNWVKLSDNIISADYTEIESAGRKILFDFLNRDKDLIKSDILITANERTKKSSDFTVFAKDGIIKDKLLSVNSGQYVLGTENNVIVLRLNEDNIKFMGDKYGGRY